MSRRPALRDLYEAFNAQFWNGRLPHVQRELTFGGDPFQRGVSVRRVGMDPLDSRGLRCHGSRGAFGIFRRPGEFSPSEIRVLSPLGAAFERKVLLHEMAHCAVWFAGIDDEPAHGPGFLAELERLATMGEAWATEQVERYRRAAQ